VTDVAWPSTLVDRIAADRWVLFIGSGVSASCTNEAGSSPPAWKTLLRHLCKLISNNDQRAIGTQLIDSGDLLSAADHIRYVLDSESNLAAYGQAIRTAIEGPTNDKYSPSELWLSVGIRGWISCDRLVWEAEVDRAAGEVDERERGAG